MAYYYGGGGLSFKQFLAVMAITIAFIFFDGWMRESGKDPECVYMVLFIVAIAYFFGRKKIAHHHHPTINSWPD